MRKGCAGTPPRPGESLPAQREICRHATAAVRPGPFCQTGRPVWQCKTAQTASQNGPFCTAMTKARQTGCGSTGCAKCHDMTKTHTTWRHTMWRRRSQATPPPPRPQHRKRPARLDDKPGHTENQHKLEAKTTEMGNATASQHAELKHFSCFFIAVCNFIRTFA